MTRARANFLLVGGSLVIAAGLLWGQARLAQAQTFIEPPAAPTGGNTAGWLTTGATDERKLGSLLVGSSASPATLCLNAADTSDPVNCISSWAQALGLAGGPFVPLRTTGLSLANQSDPTQYFVTPAATNPGASVIQGSGPNQAFSLIAEANPDNNAGYGLFAGDGGNANNYAAQFVGRVGIGNTILSSGAPGPAGQFCLNSTALYVSGGATGCIDAWGDLAMGSLAGFVKLQPTNPPVADVGSSAASVVGNFGGVIFGHPPVGQPAQTFCGDGLCSTNINEDQSADANYCPIDCAAPNPPANLAIFDATNTVINVQIVSQAQVPAGPVRVVLVRSTNPSFINDLRSAFVPQNGVIYSTGQQINGVFVAYSQVVAPSGFSVFDNVPAPNVTYYYRLYQANLFPIYNTSPRTTQATPQ